jgi:hypothetical protein
MSGDSDLLEKLVIVFIAFIAIGVIWMIASALGPFLPPAGWLVLIGVVGLLAVYAFAKMK